MRQVTKKTLDNELIHLLISSKTSADFMCELPNYFLKCKGRKYSYSDFANLFGFSSKGYTREMMIGEKPLTLKSVTKIIKGLDLKGNEGILLETMVQHHYEKNKSELGLLETKIERLRKNLKQKLDAPNLKRNTHSMLMEKKWPFVFSALGEANTGSTLDEICQKTNLKPNICIKVLQMLINEKIVLFENHRYYPKASQIYISELGKDQSYRNFYLDSLELIKSGANRYFNSNNNLFANSVVSVNKSSLPKLTQELQNLFAKYIADIETPNGDQLVILNLSLLSDFYH